MTTTVPEAGGGTAFGRFLSYVPLILVGVAAGFWVSALFGVAPGALEEMGDLGLTAVLPWQYFAALATLLLGFPLLLSQARLPRVLGGVYVALLAAIWHLTPAVLYGTPRYPFSYKHIGVSTYIQQNGSVDPNIDAYFNWPGFFALNAFLSELDPRLAAFDLSVWAPFLMNLLVSLALVILMRSLDARPESILLSVWIYQLASWVGQDYFAPQAFALVQHLTILGLYVGYFCRTSWRESRDASPLTASQGRRSGILMLIVVLFAAIAVSHQLTPFVTIASVASLLILRFGKRKTLLLSMITLLALHFVYLAQAYFAGHLGELLSYVGRLMENLEFASQVLVDAETETSPGRRLVLTVRQSLTLLMAGLALVGWARRRRQRLPTWPAAILTAVPVTLIALQPYGGEMFLRIYLFSLPFLAFFVAALLLPRPGRPLGVRRGITMLLVTSIIAGGTLIAYYGNESMNYIGGDELEVLQELVDVAPEGALVVTQTDNAPIRHARYQEFGYIDLPRVVAGNGLEPSLSSPFALHSALTQVEPNAPVYLLFTRSQTGNARLFGTLPDVDWHDMYAALEGSGLFKLVHQTSGGRLYTLSAFPEGLTP